MKFVLALALAFGLALPVLALSPAERLSDPVLEQRARDISAELRCLVCQNQSIDDSDADLAKDLRRLVRERIAAGDSNAGVKAFLTERYGEFVLLRPVFSLRNLAMWLLPFAALLGGGFAAAQLFRRAPAVTVASELTSEEQVALDRLVDVENSDDRPQGITKIS